MQTPLLRFVLLFLVSSFITFTSFGQSNAPITVCAGQDIVLTAPETGDVYLWKGPNGFEASSASIKIENATLAMAGIYQLSIKTKQVKSPSETKNSTEQAPVEPEQFTTKNTEFVVNISSVSDLIIEGNPMVNQGQTLTLTVKNTGKVTWTNPANEQVSGNVFTLTNASTAQSGKYVCTWETGNCVFTKVIDVVVIPAENNGTSNRPFNKFQLNIDSTAPFVLTAGVYDGNSKCPNSSAQLFYDYSPASGYDVNSISWSGPNNFSNNTAEPIISNLSSANAGTYTATVTYTNRATGSTGTASAICQLAVGMPVATAYFPVGTSSYSQLTRCLGSNVRLKTSLNTSNLFLTYVWQGPNGFISNSRSPLVSNISAASAGVYTVTTFFNGACSGTSTSTCTLIVNTPSANISNYGYNPLCIGSTTDLRAFLSQEDLSVTSYSWTGPNGFTSTQQIANRAISSNSDVGTFTVNIGYTGACTGTAITTYSVSTTTPYANAYGGTFCSGGNATLGIGTSSYGSQYATSWTGPNGFTSNFNNPIIRNFDNTKAGIYTATVTFDGNCMATATSTAQLTVGLPAAYAYINYYSNATVCAGSTVNLYASLSQSISSTSYSWAGPNNFTSDLQYPTISNISSSNVGVYTVTVSYSGQCNGTSTATTQLSIGLPYVYGYVSGSSTKCAGSNAQLQAYMSQSVDNVSYQWAGPNGFASNQQYPTITNISTANSGNYTVTATFSGNCNGTSSAIIQLYVGPPYASAYISNGSTKCEGSTVNLNSYLSQSDLTTTYQWTGPNNFTSNLQYPVVQSITSLNAGVYTVAIAYSGICNGTATTSTQLYIGQPNFSAYVNNGNIKCAGMAAQLYVSMSQSGLTATYIWAGPNGFTSNNSSPTINSVSASNVGTYTVTIAYSGACNGTATATTSLAIGVPTATAYGGGACGGSNVTLGYNFTHGGLTTIFQWTGPNGFSSTSPNPTISNFSSANAGTYTLAITYSGQCNGVATSTTQLSLINPALTAYWGNSGYPSSNLCDGNSTTMYASLNIDANATYAWTGPNGFNSTLRNPTLSSFNNTKIGTYSVTVNYTSSYCPNAQSGTLTATLQLGGGANVGFNGNSTFCSGSSVTFSPSISPSVSSVSYTWYGPNGYSATGTNPNISNFTSINAGVYTVVANFSGACGGTYNGTSTATRTYSIGSPSVYLSSNNSNYCIGGTASATVILSQSDLTITSYQWAGPNNFASTQQNLSVPSFQNVSVGTYTANVTYTGVCSGNAMATITFGLKSGQVANLLAYVQEGVYPCLGSTVNLKSSLLFNVLNTATYAWQGPNGFTSVQQNPQLSNVAENNVGVYTVTANYAGTNACGTANGTAISTVNLILNPTILATNSVVCGGTAPTNANALRATSSAEGDVSYTYTGGTVGYDSGAKSGTDPTITISSTETIKKMTITVYWEKKSSGNQNSCGSVDGGGSPFYGEAKFSLRSPDGTTIILVNSSRMSYTSNKGTLSTTFDDAGLTTLSGEPFSKTYQPDQLLAAFNNKSLNGIWTLLPEDVGGGDPLCVKSFTLNFTPNRTETVTWYDVPTGGTSLATGKTYLPSVTAAGTYTYYADATFNTSACTGTVPRKPVTLTIVPASTTVSMKSGNWNDGTTWSCGLIPTNVLNTTVQAGHIVSIPTGVTGQAKTVNVLGNIDFKPNASLQSNQ